MAVPDAKPTGGVAMKKRVLVFETDEEYFGTEASKDDLQRILSAKSLNLEQYTLVYKELESDKPGIVRFEITATPRNRLKLVSEEEL
jgi:hypothetical protein